MKVKTKFTLLRASIYLTGLATVLWVIGSNIWEIKEQTATPVQAENGDFVVYTDKNYQRAQLTIEFENQIPENFTAQIQKDFSIFLKTQKKGVYSKEELKEKLFKNNPTQIPNGNFIKHQKAVYLIEEGQLRRISSSKILHLFNLREEEIPEITPEQFNQLLPGEPLTHQSIQEKFPEEILIKKGEQYFTTSDNGYNPIYISNPTALQKELNLQTTPVSDQQILGECFKTTDQQINCNFNLNNLKLKTGDIYRLSFADNTNQPPQNIKSISITLQSNPSLPELTEETRKLFVK